MVQDRTADLASDYLEQPQDRTPDPGEEHRQARTAIAREIMEAARTLNRQAEYADLRFIAYLLELVVVEAADFVETTPLDRPPG